MIESIPACPNSATDDLVPPLNPLICVVCDRVRKVALVVSDTYWCVRCYERENPADDPPDVADLIRSARARLHARQAPRKPLDRRGRITDRRPPVSTPVRTPGDR